MTPNTPVWKAIAASVRGDLAAGIYTPGEKLPTEAVLARRFGVNRHTVRHALSALADEDLVYSRRGAGVFVKAVPTDYPIGRRVRYHQNLRLAGRTPAKKILLLDTRPAYDTEKEALRLQDGAQVNVCEGLSLAEDRPVALFRSVFCATRFPDILAFLEQEASVTAALRRSGVPDYTRASTRINALLATPTQALHLQIAQNTPVLRTIGINVDPDGTPVEAGLTWFAGDKVTLTLSDT